MFTRFRQLCLAAAGLWAFATPLMAATSTPQPLFKNLSRAAPGLNPVALQNALAAMQCALNSGAEQAQRLAVIDYSQPSTARRLWIFDLRKQALVLQDLVAHGQKSGEN